MTEPEKKPIHLVFVEKDADTYELIRSHLASQKILYTLECIPRLSDAVLRTHETLCDILLIDADDDEDPAELFVHIGQINPRVPCLLLVSARTENLTEKIQGYSHIDLMVKNELPYGKLAERLQRICHIRWPGRDLSAPSAEVISAEMSEENKNANALSSIRDTLTGVYNHSHLFERMAEEFARAKRHGHPLSCLVLDIDHFKSINEKWNHRAGDQLLKESVQLILGNCRLGDFIARYGGEEFAILMPHTDYKGASVVAERLRTLFAEHGFHVEAEEVRLTVSIGLCSFPEDLMEKRAELLSFAIQALYKSKALGRNRITRYQEIVPVFGKDDLPTLRISEEKILEFQRRITEVASNARRFYLDAAKAMIMALESKDSFTAGHAGSVARYTGQIVESMGLSLDESEVIEHAALLHDIGKICIPDQILLKPGKLTFAEFETMRQHPYLGYKMLKPLKFLDREAQLVLHHHEWYNGEGYPCRLKSDEIPLGARVIAVADAYDTMRSAGGRYKKTCTVEVSVNELIQCSLIQFDPRVVQAFIQVLILRGELSPKDFDKSKLEDMLKKMPRLFQPSRIPTAS